MAYSKKVLEHYENPSNVGSFDKGLKDVGTGLVGAPECGDVLKLQIRVNSDTKKIDDVKFKTFGCLCSNVDISTPNGYIKIKDLNIGDYIWSWDGKSIIKNQIININKIKRHYNDLLLLKFEGSVHFNYICSKDHIWWTSDNNPLEAEDLKIGDKLFQITENELQVLDNNSIKDKRQLQVSDKKFIKDKGQLEGVEYEGDLVTLYDIELKEGSNIYFAGRIGCHNCGSAIACSSLATEWLKGKTLDEARNIKNTELVEELSLPPVKIHCSVLAEDAINKAIDDWEEKNK